MADKSISAPKPPTFDWKAVGYLTSIVSVLFLGIAAWQKENPPWWYHPVVVVGMATSIIGMGCRYKSHLDEKRQIKQAQTEAVRPSRRGSGRPQRRRD